MECEGIKVASSCSYLMDQLALCTLYYLVNSLIRKKSSADATIMGKGKVSKGGQMVIR